MIKKFLIIFSILLFLFSFGQQYGQAKYYGPYKTFRRTASGEVFNVNALTCASNTYPKGTLLKVTNLKNGKSIIVRVNDKGEFRYPVVVDLTKRAFSELANPRIGVLQVKVEKVN